MGKLVMVRRRRRRGKRRRNHEGTELEAEFAWNTRRGPLPTQWRYTVSNHLGTKKGRFWHTLLWMCSHGRNGNKCRPWNTTTIFRHWSHLAYWTIQVCSSIRCTSVVKVLVEEATGCDKRFNDASLFCARLFTPDCGLYTRNQLERLSEGFGLLF